MEEGPRSRGPSGIRRGGIVDSDDAALRLGSLDGRGGAFEAFSEREEARLHPSRPPRG